ncbi:hypothetical protein AB0K16_22220 [Nonomuraea jabiensis]|uniref:hypothetical protein n=1 Tax=Nonomuraea jabiensis TaxID=882448 RepID=UPI00344610C5
MDAKKIIEIVADWYNEDPEAFELPAENKAEALIEFVRDETRNVQKDAYDIGGLLSNILAKFDQADLAALESKFIR